MLRGGCLRGGVRFEIAQIVGPFELCHCHRCGSPVPDPAAGDSWIEVHAGVLDDDPGLRPERHILVEAKSAWFTIADELPRLDRAALTALRNG